MHRLYPLMPLLYAARAMRPATNIAVRAARQAGSVLLRYHDRVDALTVSEKRANDYVSEVDRAAEQAIIQTIRKAYPDHAILAEESGAHAGNEYQWIIDPLDGTTNYLHGIPQFAISIALLHRGKLEAGVVYDPLRDEMFSADQGGGAYLNDRRIRVTEQKGLRGALLGTGIPFRDQRFVDNYLGMMKSLMRDTAGIRRPGSAALDFAYVACGRYDGFWELGLSIWDFAAGALLVKEAGGVVSDIAGGDRYLETGNVITAGVRLHGDMVKAIRPHLSEQLTA
jgi:myo-inositol-1(or 4)-monophosphatase